MHELAYFLVCIAQTLLFINMNKELNWLRTYCVKNVSYMHKTCRSQQIKDFAQNLFLYKK